MHMDRLQSAREGAAEQRAQLRYREIEKCALALGFQRGGMAAAEKSLDLRAAERPQMIGGGRGAIGGAEQAAVRVEFLRALERQEQLIGKAEWQAARGPRLLRQRRREQLLDFGEHRAGQGHDRLIAR